MDGGGGASTSSAQAVLMRVLPWLASVVTANVLHYRSLLEACQEVKKTDPSSPAPDSSGRLLSFDLMRSPSMRRVRYKIRLARYAFTLAHLALFAAALPELRLGPARRTGAADTDAGFTPGYGTLEALVGGLLSGLVAIHLDENRAQRMRARWQPAADFSGCTLGTAMDALRVIGGCALDPLEEQLFYHSWLYRYLCLHVMSGKGHGGSFLDVPLREWNWAAWLLCNAFWGVYNGPEWGSHVVLGLLSNWAIARQGQFLDGVITHSIHNFTISCWVLRTDQRQFW